MQLPTEYDPRRAIAAHQAQERNAWDRYAAAVLAETDDENYAAELADKMLSLRRERFPGPRFTQLEDGQ